MATRQSLRAARGEGIRLAALGMAGYAVESGLFFAGLRHGTVGAVTLLFFTYPVWVAVGSLLLGRGMPGWLVGLSLGAAVAGAAVVALSSGGLDIDGAGIALALSAAVTFAAYLVGADAVLRRTPSLTGAAWVSGSASIGLALAAGVTTTGDLPNGPHGWWTVAGMGVLTALAFVALFGALRRLGAVRTSAVSALEPLAAAMLAVAFIGERLRPGTALGGALILAGAVAASVARGVPVAEPPVP